jgi:serine/threonine protein kinase
MDENINRNMFIEKSLTQLGSNSINSSFNSCLPNSNNNKDNKNLNQGTYNLTVGIVDTYTKCNPSFKSVEKLPQRVLTNPAIPTYNNGNDNAECNLICRVHDTLESVSSTGTSVYTILDLLGTGTFGQVFRCQKSDTVELCAVKVIKNKAAYHTQGILEIKIAKLLNKDFDPNNEKHIVRLIEYFEFKGHICIVFELLSISLLDILTQNQFRGLPLSVVQRFTKQILSALVALQDANIVHCDLKPENILLCTNSKQKSKSNNNKIELNSENNNNNKNNEVDINISDLSINNVEVNSNSSSQKRYKSPPIPSATASSSNPSSSNSLGKYQFI